jgi:hypothetical protein
MPWWELSLRYLWIIGLTEVMRSRRLPVEGKMLFLLGLVPFFAVMVVGTQVVWVLTGRGRRVRRLLGGNFIVIFPGMRDLPPEFRAQMEEVREHWETERPETPDAA